MRPTVTVILLLLFFFPSFIRAQEENATVAKEGSRYIDLKVRSLEKYNKRIEHQQEHLLNRLKRKEKRFAHKLRNTDSLAYAKYQKQTFSYDSISKLSNTDTGSTAAKFEKQKNGTIDSLKGVQSFVQSKSDVQTNSPELQNQNTELIKLKGQLNFRNYINQLISQRINSLNNLAGQNEKIPGLTGIQKQVFYSKAKMKVFKDMEEEPTKAEDEAMEYLQGSNGFEKAMKNATGAGNGSMEALEASGADASQLEKMGYQTRKQIQSGLQQKFGSNLGGVSKQLSSQISEFQNKQKDLANLKEDGQSLKQLRGIGKPSFKVNPMRGLPFWKRIEKQYSFQTARASSDGKQPVTIEPAVMAGFKHTPRLTYGVGLATSVGLGQGWQNIRLSYQGTGCRIFATWQWQYGIGAYTGYERMYKNFSFANVQNNAQETNPSPHNTQNYTESILIGLTKSYRMNSKYNGAIQVLYDVWWEQKGLRSPFVLRYVTMTK